MKILKKIYSILFLNVGHSFKVVLRYLLNFGSVQKIVPDKRRRALVVFNENACVGCKLCMKICPSKAIRVKAGLNGKKEEIDFSLSGDLCVACGLCVESCPEQALFFETKENHVCS